MTGAGASPVLRVEGAVIVRGRGRDAVTVLRDTDLTVRAGEIIGISGPSGAGKSSLLGVLAGELTAAAGTVELRAASATGPPRRVRRLAPGSVALVAQDPMATLDPLWPVDRSVAEPLRAAGISRAEARARALDALQAVGLAHLGPGRRPRELSTGQAQRACIARALSGRPVLLLADEVTSALDVTTAAAVAALLRDAADAGTAVIMVSHNHLLLDSVCDRRLHLAGGRLQAHPAVPSSAHSTDGADETA